MSTSTGVAAERPRIAQDAPPAMQTFGLQTDESTSVFISAELIRLAAPC